MATRDTETANDAVIDQITRSHDHGFRVASILQRLAIVMVIIIIVIAVAVVLTAIGSDDVSDSDRTQVVGTTLVVTPFALLWPGILYGIATLIDLQASSMSMSMIEEDEEEEG